MKEKYDEQPIFYKVEKIPEKDADFVKVTKLIYGFRENPEFIFRILRFLDDLRTSNLSFAVKERKDVFDRIDNSFYYFIANNLYNNLSFTNSKDDEFLSLIFRLLKEQINDKYEHFLDDGSVLSNIFKAMLIQVDMKEKFKEILQEILFKMEELSDEEWLLDIDNINNFIFNLKENKGPITQKVKNLFLKPRKDILKNDERLFRKYENFKISKELIEKFDEEKYGNMRGYVAKVVSFLEHKIQGGGIQNDEEKYQIKHFYNELKNTSNQELALYIYKHYFLIIRKILHLIIDTLISKIDYIPYVIRGICNMIEILGKNSYNNKLTNFDILSLIGKYFLNNVINLYLFDERYIAMLDFAPISQYSKQNYKMVAKIFSTLQSGNLFSKDNSPNLIPFNALFYNELLPKLFNFYKSLTNVDFTPYLDELISGKIKDHDFSYDFFKKNPDDIFRNMSICFNINNYISFLTLFKVYTKETKDRREFYKRGDKNCINNMKQYFGAESDYKEFKTSSGSNKNKQNDNDNNYKGSTIFHLYYSNRSKDFDLANDKDDSQIIFSLPETNLQEIESEEEFRENEVKKMKNRLCLLLYRVKDLDGDNYPDDEKNNLLSIIGRLITISKEEVIGKTLKILIGKIIKQENGEFNYKLFEDLDTGIVKYSDDLEKSYQKMSLAYEYLRSVTLKIKTLFENNDKLLLYNSYLNIEDDLLNKNFNTKTKYSQILYPDFNQFVNNFFNIKDEKLQDYYNLPVTDSFINLEKYFIFSKEQENEKKGYFYKDNPKQVNAIIEYMEKLTKKKQINEKYKEIIIDFISTRVYDCLINHKPNKEDIFLFNKLIEIDLNYEIGGKAQMEQKVFHSMILSMKKLEKLRGNKQKFDSFNGLFKIFADYSTFMKGKTELNAADDNVSSINYSISKYCPKSLISICKYGCLFEKGYNNFTSLIGSLTSVLNDVKKKVKST